MNEVASVRFLGNPPGWKGLINIGEALASLPVHSRPTSLCLSFLICMEEPMRSPSPNPSPHVVSTGRRESPGKESPGTDPPAWASAPWVAGGRPVCPEPGSALEKDVDSFHLRCSLAGLP